MSQRDIQIVKKILAEISMVYQLMDDMTEDIFMQDERTARAVCMTLINIGELVKSLTDELKQAHPEIPWRAISGMRDVTAHKYQTLRKEDVYHTCEDDIPLFELQLRELIGD